MSKKQSNPPEIDVLGKVGKLLDPAPVDEQFRRHAKWQARLLRIIGIAFAVFLFFLVFGTIWRSGH